jgi:hypothetical protein
LPAKLVHELPGEAGRSPVNAGFHENQLAAAPQPGKLLEPIFSALQWLGVVCRIEEHERKIDIV